MKKVKSLRFFEKVLKSIPDLGLYEYTAERDFSRAIEMVRNSTLSIVQRKALQSHLQKFKAQLSEPKNY